MVRKALGRGLEALIPAAVEREVPIVPDQRTEPRAAEPRAGDIQHLPLAKIVRNPSQPRTQFDPATIRELAASIRERGVLQPVLVRPSGDGYQIVAGERRFLAAREAGFHSIPAIVRPLTDRESLLIALIENIQRENLNAIDEARAYYRLATEYGLQHDEIGQRVGKDRSTVSNIIRFNNLPQEVQALIESEKLSAGHARALLSLTSPKQQIDLAAATANHGWSVRELEERIKRSGVSRVARPRRAPRRAFSAELMSLEDELMRIVGSKVRITRRRGGSGSILLEYHSEEELDRLLGLLREIGGQAG
ncbi:MAG TPA: ParB/RepB/Spo0J family partition protein [Candidatus Eisenbacteria bacterium]